MPSAAATRSCGASSGQRGNDPTVIKRVNFKRHKRLAFALLAPQMLVLAVFVFWPAAQALFQAFTVTDPFGQRSMFVWFDNFTDILSSPEYFNSIYRTAIFSTGTTFGAVATGLLFAVLVDRVVRGRSAYRLLIIWPYAIAPVLAGVLWLFLFHPVYGAIALLLKQGLGIAWNPLLDGTDAMLLVIVAAAWKQVAYNFVFFLAALQAIPRSLIEAAAIDGAGPVRRFISIVFPLISPTTFFLLVINVVYAFFDTFGIIHTLTQGGPSGATDIMVYKVYADGFLGLDLGLSSAQSVILMILVIALTALQFRFLERRVKYAQ
jgi:sn-glycerol 3-phosphate transport system permease protein